jgi:hypothetical protein
MRSRRSRLAILRPDSKAPASTGFARPSSARCRGVSDILGQ